MEWGYFVGWHLINFHQYAFIAPFTSNDAATFWGLYCVWQASWELIKGIYSHIHCKCKVLQILSIVPSYIVCHNVSLISVSLSWQDESALWLHLCQKTWYHFLCFMQFTVPNKYLVKACNWVSRYESTWELVTGFEAKQLFRKKNSLQPMCFFFLIVIMFCFNKVIEVIQQCASLSYES